MREETQKESLPERLVVKFGTANFCNTAGKIDQNIFNDFTRQIVELIEKGAEVIIVSSGGIKSGLERMEDLGLTTTYLDKKELAGIGARHLMNRWGNAFEVYQKEVSQIWITYSNWNDKGERESIKSSILNSLKAKVTPVINELDVVSDWEIKWMEQGISENDRLAKMIALLIEAEAILFLTNEGGVCLEDPKINSRTELYKEISVSTLEKSGLAGISDNISEFGRGGMRAKFKEASECAQKGMMVAIAGREKDVIIRFARGESVGTKIIK